MAPFRSTRLSAFVLSACVGWTTAAPLNSCGLQAQCVDFRVSKRDTVTCNGECAYKVCMELDLTSRHCVKDAHDTVSHTCLKDSHTCISSQGFALTKEVQNLPTGHIQCQIVEAGGVAEFLLKDGHADEGCNLATKDVRGAAQLAQCETYVPDLTLSTSVRLRYKDGSCTGMGNRNQECVWRVPVPAECGETTSAPTTRISTAKPTTKPTNSPSGFPTKSPVQTTFPSKAPSTSSPSSGPTKEPSTSAPSSGPTKETSTSSPSFAPTKKPPSAFPR